MKVLEGTVASAGLVRGTAVVVNQAKYELSGIQADSPEEELSKLTAALQTSLEELIEVKERMREEMGEESAHIFRAQQTILEDESIIEEIRNAVESEKISAVEAVNNVFSTYLQMFEELGEDDYNKARMTDLADVQKRVVRNILGEGETDLSSLGDRSIVVAEELFPSETAGMNVSEVIGMVTEKGGLTSHVAILARNRGIPALVGVKDATSELDDGETVWIDATNSEKGVLYASPDDETEHKLDVARNREHVRQETLAREKFLSPVTTDGHVLTLSANVGTADEIPHTREFGATSVGLFRTEFLFMNRSVLPDEETQYAAYKEVAGAFSDGFVILRTIDVGGDKPVESISIPEEKNPFLGYRGVRISLDVHSILRDQLRAAFRASAHGPMKIMFPMISGPNEMKQLVPVVKEIREELDSGGFAFDPDVEIGIMIEVPSAVFMARELAGMADFASIGTNDLTQYLLAADRMNEKVGDYYQPYHPSVFRAIKHVVDAFHNEGKWVGICGELGGMAPAIPALVGLGVDELSMNAPALSEATYVIRRVSKATAENVAAEVLAADEEHEVKRILREVRIPEE
ncbi:MAG: phosphoenolpyruvate--protein phosphotransferase [Spirochaetaceae bacterium]